MNLSFFDSLSNKKAILTIILLGFIVFFNALFNGFVWDDEGQIVNNQQVHSIQNLLTFFEGGTFDSGDSGTKLAGSYYKPLMTTSFSLIYTFFGNQAFFFHLFQITLHIANAIMVFLLFSYFFSKKTSLIISTIFVIHPINVEAVAYISALQEVLFFFFGMLGFMLVLHKEKVKSRASYYILLAYFLCMLSSILSKETGILFIMIIPVFVFLYQKKQFFQYALASLASFVVYCYLRFFVGHMLVNTDGINNIPIVQTSLFVRLETIPKIILFYLQTFFFPMNLSIAHMWIVRSLTPFDFYIPIIVLGTCCLLLSLSVVLWHKRKLPFFKQYVFFTIWFLLGLGFHLQIFPLDMTVADRWFYFPMIGLLGMIAIILITFTNKYAKSKLLLQSLVIFIVLIFSIRTIIRNADWNNNFMLYSHDLSIDNNNYFLQNVLGIEELTNLKRVNDAQKHFQSSILLFPTASAYSNLGVAYLSQNNLPKAEKSLSQAIQIDNKYYPSYENLAYVLLKLNNPKKASEIIHQGLLLPNNHDQLWLLLTFAEYKMGNRQKAIQAVKNAIAISPDSYSTGLYTNLVNNLPIDSYFR